MTTKGTGDDLDQLSGAFNDVFQKLKDSYNRIVAFTADASHELRLPITAIKGEARFNRINECSGAVEISWALGEENAVCITKHGNACGIAIKDTLLEAYVEALKCETVAAFGGVVSVNGTVDKALAEKMNEILSAISYFCLNSWNIYWKCKWNP